MIIEVIDLKDAPKPHIRKYGRGNGKLTECGAPATRNDVRSSAWLKPFAKCPECSEAIRVRMARVAATIN